MYKYDELERSVHASLFSWSVLAISVASNAISSGQRIAGSKHCDRSPRDEIARSPWNNAPCPIKTVLIFRSEETRVKFTGVQQGNGARAHALGAAGFLVQPRTVAIWSKSPRCCEATDEPRGSRFLYRLRNRLRRPRPRRSFARNPPWNIAASDVGHFRVIKTREVRIPR